MKGSSFESNSHPLAVWVPVDNHWGVGISKRELYYLSIYSSIGIREVFKQLKDQELRIRRQPRSYWVVRN